MYSIRLVPTEEIFSILPLLKMLNNQITEETLRERLSEMIKQGYECVGVYHHEELVGISGIWFLTKYYVGKHVEPDNVIIHPDHRGAGLGEKMMQWIYDYAKSKGCMASELNCYTSNHGGQKFWMNEGYKVIGFHYQKQL